MFKPELWQSHNEYKALVESMEHKLSRNYQKYLFSDYDIECRKLLSLNLDPLAVFLSGFYSPSGRPASNQAQIIRSLILFTLLFNKTKARTSLSLWVNDVLPNSISLTVLIGCKSTDDLPPLGSCYDFMNRFWLAPRNQYSRTSLLPAGRNSNKPDKNLDDNGKLAESEDPCKTTVKDIVSNIMNGKPACDNPQNALHKIFFILAVAPSVRLGLIDAQSLTLSGDGTSVPSHSSPFGRHLPSCPKDCSFRSDCMRHYSDPDAGWGWDSHEKEWFFGHTLYMLCSRNNSLHTDLPVLMNFTDARRHDSKNFLYAIDALGRCCFELCPKNICLDSAHDNIPTYELLERWGINALIDINKRSKYAADSPSDISFGRDGLPLCRAGHKMCPWGNDPVKDAHKYRCPLKCGRISSCPFSDECSPGKYGRTIYIKNHGDLRFHPRIPRDSQLYKEIYSERTACERVNNRVLNDYCLQHLKIRGRDHFSFWTILIGICIHLDARFKARLI